MNEIAPAITPVQEIQNGPDYGSLLQEGLDIAPPKQNLSKMSNETGVRRRSR